MIVKSRILVQLKIYALRGLRYSIYREMKWEYVVVIYDNSIESLVSYDSFVSAAFEHLVCSELDIQLEAYPFQIEYEALRDGFFNRTLEGSSRGFTSLYNEIDLKMRTLFQQRITSNGVL